MSAKVITIQTGYFERTVIMQLSYEITVIPVSDVDRAKSFYQRLGFREDADFTSPRGLRVVQFTPPGSAASIIFGENLTEQQPGSARGLHLVTPDLEGTRAELVARGVEVSPIWHDQDGIFHWAGTANRVDGPHPTHDSYASYVSFADPDGNEWIIQQIIDRLPGR
jgi:catechol 2,3-dioxygenase-like lactoylglutathione lyase family enzyme